MFRGAFPDLEFVAEDMFAEGDKVAARITVRGTHKGPFLDIAPTGKQVSVSAIDIFRFANGKIVRALGRDGPDEHDAAAGGDPPVDTAAARTPPAAWRPARSSSLRCRRRPMRQIRSVAKAESARSDDSAT